MNIYSHYGFKDFIICGGYKYEKIIQYFRKFLDFKLKNKKKINIYFILERKIGMLMLCSLGRKLILVEDYCF